jgi:hypothetical protein
MQAAGDQRPDLPPLAHPLRGVKQDEAHRLMAFEQENTRLKRGIN